jgi:hypothetical protein
MFITSTRVIRLLVTVIFLLEAVASTSMINMVASGFI